MDKDMYFKKSSNILEIKLGPAFLSEFFRCDPDGTSGYMHAL